MKFLVSIEETLSRLVVVEADNGTEAEHIVRDKYNACDIVLDSNDFSDVEIMCIKKASASEVTYYEELEE